MTDEQAEAEYYEQLLGHEEPEEINRDITDGQPEPANPAKPF